MKKPTVKEAYQERDAKLVVTVKPDKLFRDWKTYKIRLAIGMALIRMAGWFVQLPVETRDEEGNE